MGYTIKHCSKPLLITSSSPPSGSCALIRAGSTNLPLESSLHSYSLVKKVIDCSGCLFLLNKHSNFVPTFNHFTPLFYIFYQKVDKKHLKRMFQKQKI